ncbi:MAG: transglutaminase domain-containing protein [Bacteroidetes bacterium]|nr:transglutaminase domain-containing protein [Bacteroidota bacterium]
MKNLLHLTLLFLVLIISVRTQAPAQGLLSPDDRAYYSSLLEERRARLPQLEARVFCVLDSARRMEEKDALLFLFATSPLSDLVDRDGDYFQAVVRVALDARASARWGNDIPASLFVHFVLPPRVNNEALDEARLLFPSLLAERVAGLSMHDAVLEINHWCHSKVTYAPSDARTRAPLATIRNATGRCGEESVFTVTAMRAAGIPARQVYVPRWAHADDNHAWVEVWVDGAWHFLGACEPDVDLDHAWFAEPARRAMLTSAFVLGRYQSDEEQLSSKRQYTRINTLPVYADTRVVNVQLRDEAGRILPDAWVDFRIYNYAEFYPLTSTLTDRNGCASLRTGYGDLLVWAHLGDRYAYRHVTRDESDTVRLVLAGHPQHLEREVLDIIPPPPAMLENPEHPRAAEIARRLLIDDSLRSDYESHFVDSVRTASFASEFGYPADSCWLLLHAARGNGEEILSFLADAASANSVPALGFLNTLAVKDLQDAPAAVLLHHYRIALGNRAEDQPCDEMFLRYVCCPRIGREELRPWRKALQLAIATNPAFLTRNPVRIAAWVRDSIRMDSEANWAHVPLPADRSYELRTADETSRNILFVALCRSAGIAARLEPATGIPQYRSNDRWISAALEEERSTPATTAELMLRVPAHQHIQQPEYARHFTLARFEDGTYHTLDYEGDAIFDHWPATLHVQPGEYLLTMGNRQPDGSVLASMEFFSLDAGKRAEHEVHIRDDDDAPVALAAIDPALLPREDVKAWVLIWIERGTEPVSHALLDIADKRMQLDALPVQFLLAGDGVMTEEELQSIARVSLPKRFITDKDGAQALHTHIADQLQLPVGMQLPLIVVCDERGNITFSTRGYTIGVGAQIQRVLERMRLED